MWDRRRVHRTAVTFVLSPFWLLGRVAGVVVLAGRWVYGSMVDGYQVTPEQRAAPAGLLVVWLVALTVIVFWRG